MAAVPWHYVYVLMAYDGNLGHEQPYTPGLRRLWLSVSVSPPNPANVCPIGST